VTGRLRAVATTGAVALSLLSVAWGVRAADEPPRRDDALPGLPAHEQLVDPSEPWHDQALATAIRVRPSVLLVGNQPDWPPLTGFVVGPRHALTAHPWTPTPGVEPPEVFITTLDGDQYTARQVAGWPEWDLALLEVDRPFTVPPVVFGDEGALSPDDPVVLVQNPFMQGRSGAWLITAATFRRAETGMFKGSISSGSGGSGSAIFNLEGEVVGMSSMGFDGGPQGSAIEQMTVSELELRSTVPHHLPGTFGGVGGARMAALVREALP
jgi:hypothetical protein